MGHIYLTRHGRTYANELWSLLSQEGKSSLNPRQEISLDRLRELVSDEEKRDQFLVRNNLSGGFFPFGLSTKGLEQAAVLGRYLASRTELVRIIVPTKDCMMIFRNQRTAERIKFESGRNLVFESPSCLSEQLGREYSASGDDERVDQIVGGLCNFEGGLFVLNSGLLERIVGVAGESLEFFDNCGLVVLRYESGRLSVAEGYISNDEIQAKL
jgi:hypothetical protein